jgi:hypothetical protein
LGLELTAKQLIQHLNNYNLKKKTTPQAGLGLELTAKKLIQQFNNYNL